MGIANKNNGEESSGLYDLKELATSARKRRTQRLSSEMEAQQSLLQSSAALDAVALPDPKKSKGMAIPLIGLDTTSGANTTKIKTAATATATTMANELPQAARSSSNSSSKGWLLAGIAAIAVAGTAAFVLTKGDTGTTGRSIAAPAAAAINAPESEIPTPVQALPAVDDDQQDVEDIAVAVIDSDPDDKNSVDSAAKQDLAPKDKIAAHGDENKAKLAAGDDSEVVNKQNANKIDDKVKATTTETKVVAAKTEDKTEKLESSSSVDDILSSVTGGVEKHETVEEEKAPTKKQLERGDIAKAMKKISPEAKACYAAEEFSGVVTVKYSVEPDGSVTGAKATGAHASSKTGACVVSAVNAASFPPFSGAATSFSFPFLLSP